MKGDVADIGRADYTINNPASGGIFTGGAVAGIGLEGSDFCGIKEKGQKGIDNQHPDYLIIPTTLEKER